MFWEDRSAVMWPYFCAFSFKHSLIPDLKFEIGINLKKHKEGFFGLKEHGRNLELFRGQTFINEITHTKYHFWAVLDEIKTGNPRPWHSIIDNEVSRFVNQNKEFTLSLIRGYLPQVF